MKISPLLFCTLLTSIIYFFALAESPENKQLAREQIATYLTERTDSIWQFKRQITRINKLVEKEQKAANRLIPKKRAAQIALNITRYRNALLDSVERYFGTEERDYLSQLLCQLDTESTHENV